MKLFFLGVILFLANSAHAIEGLRLQVFPYNPEWRFERDEDQSLAQRRPVNYAAAVRKGMYSALFEYSTFKSDSGNATLNISREHQEYMLWGRVHFVSYFEDHGAQSGAKAIEKKPIRLSLFVGGGLGTYQETVLTSLSGSLATDTGKREMEGGLVFGSETVYLLQQDFGLVLGAELRLLFGKEFDPNPQVSGLLRVGVQF